MERVFVGELSEITGLSSCSISRAGVCRRTERDNWLVIVFYQ